MNIYLNRLIVFVEAPEDVEIFSRLFPGRQSEIRFLAPIESSDDSVGATADGCIAVINRVAQERADRSNPDMCIGFVDRDIYFSLEDWDTLFEHDDGNYRTRAPLGDGIRPLLYWEIENYLLNPEVIAAVLRERQKRPDRVESNLLAAISRGIQLNSANCLIHTHKVEAVADGLILNECADDDFGDLAKQQARKRLEQLYDEPAFDEFLGRHIDFLEDYDGEARIERAMRIVPGKALVKFLVRKYDVKGVIERSLAHHTEQNDLVHEHLVDDINQHLPA